MKVNASVPEEKITSCFRAGMAAHETTCWLFEVARILREPSIAKSTRDLHNRGADYLEKAHAQAARLARILPSREAAAVARKTAQWAAQLRKPSKPKPDAEAIKDLRAAKDRLHALGKDIMGMYTASLKGCGKSVSTANIFQELYPEREARKTIR